MGTMYIDISLSANHTSIMEEIVKNKFSPINSKRELKDATTKTKVYEGKMKNGYRKIHFREYYGRYMAVLTNPCFPKMSPFRLVVHFSQWKVLYKLFNAIKATFGETLGTYIIENGKLARMDLWVDKNLNYQDVKKFMYKPKISVSEEFRSEKGTTYLGSRKSDSYDKAYDKTDEDDLFAENPITRFERVLKGNQIPIENLKDYPILANLCMFHSLHVEIPKPHVPRLLKDPNLHPDIQEFFYHVHKEGLHFARKKMSRRRGFYTRILPFWKEHSSRIDLCEDWKTFMNDVVLQEERHRKHWMDGCEFVEDDDWFDENGFQLSESEYLKVKEDREKFFAYLLENDEVELEDDEHELEDDEHELEDDEHELEDDENNLRVQELVMDEQQTVTNVNTENQ